MAKSASFGAWTCRLCGSLWPTEEKGPFVKYSSKHYAHMQCFVDAGKNLDLLRKKQQRELQRWLRRKYLPKK
jgi:hypothetical protein